MKKVVGFLFFSFLTLFAVGVSNYPVLKTGQTTSYMAGDDGDYEVGVGRSYTAGSDVVTDNVTGLQWQDDAGGSTMDWANAVTYCSNLSLGGHDDWRLPSVQELRMIVDYGQENPATDTAFTHSIPDRHWSSTSFVGNVGYAWAVDLLYGDDIWVDKTASSNVRCVRGMFVPINAHARDSATQTVYGVQTNLTWQDDTTVSDPAQRKAWSDAITYCENLSFAGVNDWRLPNINELLSITDNNRPAPAINPAFANVGSDDYWSSTITAIAANNAWSVFANAGNKNRYHTSTQNSVRCVRSGQLPAPVAIDPNQVYASVQITEGWNLITVPFNTDEEFDVSSLIQNMATIGWKFKFISAEGESYAWDKWQSGVSLKLKNGEGLFVGIPSTLLPRPSDYIQFQGIKNDTLLKFEDKTYLQGKWYLLGFGYEVKVSDILTHYPNAMIWSMENGAYKKLVSTDVIKLGQGFWFKY